MLGRPLIRSTANKRLVRKGYSTRNARGFAGSLAKRWNAPTANNIRARLIAERDARKLARAVFAKEAVKPVFVEAQAPAENVMEFVNNMSRPSSEMSDPGIQGFYNAVPAVIRPTPLRRLANRFENEPSLLNITPRVSNIPVNMIPINTGVMMPNSPVTMAPTLVNVPVNTGFTVANAPVNSMPVMANAPVNSMPMMANAPVNSMPMVVNAPVNMMPVMPVPPPEQTLQTDKEMLEQNRERLARLFEIDVRGENKPMALKFKCSTFKSTVLDPLRSVTEVLVAKGKTQAEQDYIREQLANNLAIMEEGCQAIQRGDTTVDKKFLGRTSAFLESLHTRYVKGGRKSRRATRKAKKNRKH